MRSIIGIIALLLLHLPALAQQTYRIQGRIDSLAGSPTVYLKKQDNSRGRMMTVATTKAGNGQFSFQQAVPEPDYYTVSIDGMPGQISFILDGDVTITSAAKDLRMAEVSGSRLTDAWKAYQNEVERPYRDQLMTIYNQRQQASGDAAVAERVQADEKRLKAEHLRNVAARIREQPSSPLSLFLLNGSWNEFPKDEARSLFNGLDTALKTHSVGKRLARQLQ